MTVIEGLRAFLVLADGKRIPVAPERIRFDGTRDIRIDLGPWAAEFECQVVGAEVNGMEIGSFPERLQPGDTYTMSVVVGLSVPEYKLPPQAGRRSEDGS